MTEVKAHIVHFGCRLNQYESDALSASLEENNLSLTADACEADYVVINTCTVTNAADYKNRAAIRKIHDTNPKAKIIVTGCYATTDKEFLRQTPGVFWVVDNLNKAKIPQMIQNQNTNTLGMNLPEIKTETDHRFAYSYRSKKGHVRAYLKVQDGCNKTCSYCKIPHARGFGTSRPMQECIDELRHLISLGFREIVLTGVNIGWYKDQNGANFNDLLSQLLSQAGRFYLRLSSIEPADVNAGLIELLAHEKMAKFLHVPLQSGSKEILKRMRRGYTPKHFRQWVQAAVEKIPGLHLGTDVIVGFPGESKEDFQQTCDFVQELRFDNVHIFPFSKRQNTSIVEELQQKKIKELNGAEIKRRCEHLKKISEAIAVENRTKFTGQTWRAIVISQDEENYNLLSENYLTMRVPKEKFTVSAANGEMVQLVFNEALEVQRLQIP